LPELRLMRSNECGTNSHSSFMHTGPSRQSTTPIASTLHSRRTPSHANRRHQQYGSQTANSPYLLLYSAYEDGSSSYIAMATLLTFGCDYSRIKLLLAETSKGLLRCFCMWYTVFSSFGVTCNTLTLGRFSSRFY